MKVDLDSGRARGAALTVGLMLSLMLFEPCLSGQTTPPTQGMSPETEAKARELPREKMGELDRAEANGL